MKMCWNKDDEAWIALALLLLLGAHPGSAQVPRDEFFPFGPSNGDSTLESCDSCSSNPITLEFPLVFFNTTYRSLYVNTDGTISIKSGISSSPGVCGLERNRFGPLIAPFWSDIDTIDGGSVYFRESTNRNLISKAQVEVRKGFPDVGRVSLKSVFIVTWDKVAHYLSNECPDDKLRNTFQVILTTDGAMSFVIFYYNQLTWTKATRKYNSKCASYDNSAAAVGFTAGVGHPFHEVLGNCTADVLQLAKQSNVGESGKWLFRVDSELEHAYPSDMPNKLQGVTQLKFTDRTLVNPLSRAPIISLSVHLCRGQQILNASCVFQFQSQMVSLSKSDIQIQTQIPAVVDHAKSMALCPLPYLNGQGKLKVELKLNNRDAEVSPKNYSTTVYLSEPKIEIKVNFEEDDSTDLPIIHLEWNPNIFSPNVKTLDVVGLEPQDFKTVKETKLFSAIPNSGKFSKEFDFTSASNSLVTIQLIPTDGVVVLENNTSTFNSAAISRPFCSEIVHYTDFRSKEHDATERCEEWYATDPGVSTDGVEPCPPKLDQAKRDDRFSDDSVGDFYDERSFHENATHFYRQTLPSPKSGARQQCVYNSSGDLIQTGTARGTLDGVSGIISHWFNDLQPYCDCCHSSDNCDKYFDKRPSDDGRNYVAPKFANIVGSHHFVTFDGGSYMFNGAGEFWLIQSKLFWMQIRMEPLPSKTASITTAFVMNDGVTGDIQVEVKGDGSSGIDVFLDGEIIPFPLNSTERFSTKSASITKSKSGKTTIVFASGFTFVFEDITVTAGVRSLNLLASSSIFNFGNLNGLFGKFDKNPQNDLTTPNGTIIDLNSTTNQIHYDFGLTWMTTPEDSIFTYSKPQTNWSTFSQPNFKPWFKLSTFRRSTPPRVILNCEDSFPCLFDSAVTGNLDFAVKTRNAIEKFKQTLEIMTLPEPPTDKLIIITPMPMPTSFSTEIMTHADANDSMSTTTDCEPGQIELNGVTYVQEGCHVRLNCTNLTNSMEYKRIVWTKDDLFLFGVNTKYRNNHWSWHTFPAPGVQFSINESGIFGIVLLNATEETTGKYLCAAQPSNKSISEPIFAHHIVIVLGVEEVFPPQDTAVYNEIIEDALEEKVSPTHDDIHSMMEARLIQAEKEIHEFRKLVAELTSGKYDSGHRIVDTENQLE